MNRDIALAATIGITLVRMYNRKRNYATIPTKKQRNPSLEKQRPWPRK